MVYTDGTDTSSVAPSQAVDSVTNEEVAEEVAEITDSTIIITDGAATVQT